MAIIAQNAFTMQELATRLDPNGKIAVVTEMLKETNEILEDMMWLEGNLPTGHKTTIRTGLPSVYWRMLNQGVPPSKSATAQITDTCGMLEAYGQVDKKLADLNGNTAEFRLSENRPFLEAMNQELSKTLFYGDDKESPAKFLGLSTRYNTLDKAKAASAENVLDGGGQGSTNTSIWLVLWGDQTAHGIYPKGSKVGFQHEDLGEVTLTDSNNGMYQGYRDHYVWDCGLTVRDWRYIVRISNIDMTKLGTANAANLIDLMSEATELVPTLTLGKAAFYCNKRIRTALRKQIRDKENVNLTLDTYAGKRVLGFDGIPVRRCDMIKTNEARITA